MKKSSLILLILLAVTALKAQVGVNTESPSVTMHVTPTKTDATTAEGIIAPNLTRAQLISKDAKYLVAQKGALVYVTDLSGTLTTKTAKVTAVGYYYFDGAVWQPFYNNAPTTEPWYVQGGTSQATSNTQNIFQTGSVAIGSNSAGSYKFQVTGTSNITGNSRVASSTVVGNETVGGTLGVTGATTLNNALTVAGTTTQNGVFRYNRTPVSGGYLRSDASGNASWAAFPATATTEPWQVQGGTTLATTNAQNIYQAGSIAIGSNNSNGYKFQVTGTSNITGNARVGGNSTIAGNEYVTGSVGVGTTSPAAKVDIRTSKAKGGFRLQDGTQGNGRVLLSDANGSASWGALIPGTISGTRSNSNTTLSNSYKYLGMYVSVPPGKSQVYAGGMVTGANAAGYVTTTLSQSSTSNTRPNITQTPSLAGFPIHQSNTSVGQVTFFVTNNTSNNITLYLWGTVSGTGGVTSATWVHVGMAEPFIFVAY
ncbi:hypothetical protein [Dysgonomonas sp. 520]|uniref:hypothetical protein n=1 Tax=Dysgonomonas sp. 520 TaxID=2302931 RepID=UPI0013D2A58E|nr:hypothetical protein [Dysgonomonas sp. 520]NDW10789.1 hypothetical protein [Dysgonomonas sp. 520]